MNISSISINRPVLASVISILLFSGFGASRSFACDCKPVPSVMNAVGSAQLVIHAKVIRAELKKPLRQEQAFLDSLGEVDQVRTLGLQYVNEYTVVIVEGFKGGTANDTLVIRTGVDPVTDCGLLLSPGSEYIIYARSVFIEHQFLGSDDQTASAYSTSICTRTRPHSRREVKSIRKVLPMTENVRYGTSY